MQEKLFVFSFAISGNYLMFSGYLEAIKNLPRFLREDFGFIKRLISYSN